MQGSLNLSEALGRAQPAVLQGVWRYRWAVLGATLLAVLLGWTVSQLQTVRYEAEGELLISDPREAGVFGDATPEIGSMDRHVRNEAQRITSSTVVTRVSERLEGSMSPGEVRERIEAEASADLDVITVTAEGSTADEAAGLANAVMATYEEKIGEDIREQAQASIAELEATQDELQARVEEAESDLADAEDDQVAQQERDAALQELIATQRLVEHINVDAALYGSGVEVLEPAVPPTARTAPRTGVNMALAGLLGLGGAGAVAAWQAQTRQRADRRQEPAAILDVPLLGAVPDLGALSRADATPTVSAPESPAAEAFRFAAAAIGHELEQGMSTIVVTSPQAGDGKTTVSLNLAAVLAQENRDVLLADADVRMQGLSKLVGMPNGPGLTDLSNEAHPLESGVHIWHPTWWLNLPVAPAGGRSVDPTGFFRTARYRTALHRLQASAELLIIDAPPLLAASDASAIAGQADAIVLVVSRGTPMHVLADLQERLAFVGTPVLGYIFNRSSDRRAAYGYGYRHDQAEVHRGVAASLGDGVSTPPAPRAPDGPRHGTPASRSQAEATWSSTQPFRSQGRG